MPASAKPEMIAGYFNTYGPFGHVIETGVYGGRGSTFGLASATTEVIAIERNRKSCELARELFPMVTMIEGDSGDKLGAVLAKVDGPALLWLDAHLLDEYDGADSSPLYAELGHVMTWPHALRSVVLVDDVRLFDRAGWMSLENVVADSEAFGWAVEVSDDVVRMVPPCV